MERIAMTGPAQFGAAMAQAGRVALLVAVSTVAIAANPAPKDEAMNRLALDRGCTLCHAARAAKQSGEAGLPFAPAWNEIARRYKGRPGAEDLLVASVLRGSGPQDRHWAGKTSGARMPPNQVEVSPEEARKLVRWILQR